MNKEKKERKSDLRKLCSQEIVFLDDLFWILQDVLIKETKKMIKDRIKFLYLIKNRNKLETRLEKNKRVTKELNKFIKRNKQTRNFRKDKQLQKSDKD